MRPQNLTKIGRFPEVVVLAISGKSAYFWLLFWSGFWPVFGHMSGIPAKLGTKIKPFFSGFSRFTGIPEWRLILALFWGLK